MQQLSRVSQAGGFRAKMDCVRLALDHSHWDDESDFDIEFHVRHIALRDAVGRRMSDAATGCD